jgi:hypothetical protein
LRGVWASLQTSVVAGAGAAEAGVDIEAVGTADTIEEGIEPDADSEPEGSAMHRLLFSNRLLSSAGSQDG